MRRGRPTAVLVLTPAEKSRLELLVAPDAPEDSVSKRAKIVLLCAEGLENREVARRLGTSAHTVGRWRAQFLAAGVRGLQDAPNRGGRRPLSDEQVDNVVAIALEATPSGDTPLSTRQMAAASGVSHNSVHQIWRSFGIKPHRTTAFKLAADPLPIDKVWDVIGLYLRPPAHVLVVCIDEKSQVEAVSGVPPRPARRPRRATGEVLSSDGTDTVLLSELVEVVASTVSYNKSTRERGTEYGGFLDRIESVAPADMDVHLVVDNSDGHKAQQIRKWMSKRPRFQLHLAPAHDAWLDQVDRWFEMSSSGQTKFDEHNSEASFQAAAADFLSTSDKLSKPFVWTKSAQEIDATIARIARTPSSGDR
jgi:transposase